MKTKLTLMMAALVAFASTAQADLVQISEPLQAIQIDLAGNIVDAPSSLGPGPAIQYSNLDPGPNGFVAFGAATGLVGEDDYQSTAPADILATEFVFVGGVADVGGVITFSFTDGIDTNGFSVALPEAGNFFWTITLGDGILIPGSGTISAVVDAATAPAGGQFFLGDAGATVGSTVLGTTLIADFDNNFEITGSAVPEPTSAIALCVLGLGMVARRRR